MRAWWVAVLIFLAILVPFLLFEDEVTRLAARLLAWQGSRWLVGTGVAGLLAADLLLPVPSSMVSTGAGALLGLWPGALASFVGMTAGALLGYLLGRAGTRRFTRPADLARVERAAGRTGELAVLLLRPVPVLAEASAIFAGTVRMRFLRYLFLSSLGNAIVSVAYAYLGASLGWGRPVTPA